MTAKSASIKDAKRKSGGCAWKAVKLTSGDLPACPELGTGNAARRSDRQAEVSRGRSRRRPSVRSIEILTRKGRNDRGRKTGNATTKARTEGKG